MVTHIGLAINHHLASLTGQFVRPRLRGTCRPTSCSRSSRANSTRKRKLCSFCRRPGEPILIDIPEDLDPNTLVSAPFANGPIEDRVISRKAD